MGDSLELVWESLRWVTIRVALVKVDWFQVWIPHSAQLSIQLSSSGHWTIWANIAYFQVLIAWSSGIGSIITGAWSELWPVNTVWLIGRALLRHVAYKSLSLGTLTYSIRIEFSWWIHNLEFLSHNKVTHLSMTLLEVLDLIIKWPCIWLDLIFLTNSRLRGLIHVTLESVALILQHIQWIEFLKHLHWVA